MSQEESSDQEVQVDFSQLGLSATVLEVVKDAGFIKPKRYKLKPYQLF